MKHLGVTEKIYFDLIGIYKSFGENVEYKSIRIKDMTDDQLKYEINLYNINPLYNSSIAWLHIFNDILYKRRFKKINKLKCNINENKQDL